MTAPLLEIRNATKIYGGGLLERTPPVVALQDLNLTLPASPAQIVTIAGESGSGKSTLASLVLGFAELSSGQILFKGTDVTRMTAAQKKVYRRHVQAVFQDPYAVYNPYYRVRHVFDLVIRNFGLTHDQAEADAMIEQALSVVGLQSQEILDKYPHQLSGGQRQRMMIARAYLLKPNLIVADEPVSMVDASLRALILDIMQRLRDASGISFLYITHDLSTAYQISDEMIVLYQGRVAERGSTVKIIQEPNHPYVQQLIASIPVPDPDERWASEVVLPSDEALRAQIQSGCRYAPRCPFKMDRCTAAQPPLIRVGDNHQVACYLYDEQASIPRAVEATSSWQP
ncbi:MAG TPA: ABC transporter ATP-binding protein [Anaerolineae bacterium]|nr:ABC transporter ATP-binding protein [Anaerolineae bacterium]